MRKQIKIGNKIYKFKKDVISHYRQILNSYNFGESLNESDYNDLMDLLDYDYLNFLSEKDDADESLQEAAVTNQNDEGSGFDEEKEITIDDIRIAKVQFNTKCFELCYSDNTSQYISYLMIINKAKYTPEKMFNIACRSSVQEDIWSVKQQYFDIYSNKGLVPCQETSQLSKWTEVVVDHRQPNTFSIIVDRFKEIKNIDLDKIEFTSNSENSIIFKDESLSSDFKEYHKNKASLRIVRKECNSSRTGLARIKRTSKDLTIK